MKALAFLLLQVVFVSTISEAKLSILQPEAAKDFNITNLQNVGSCSYTVDITTSCSSTRYTRDQISISFGDAYGNQIYAPRIDDPSSKTFESCSTDRFEVYGPCAYQICYFYAYRSGPDGWKLENVKIYSHNSRAVSFYYNTFIPSDIWYGYNYCNAGSSSHKTSAQILFTGLIVGILGFLLW